MDTATKLLSAPTRPPKRRAVSERETPFFTSASDSFKPRPYLPHSSGSAPHKKLHTTVPSQTTKPVHPIPPADPSPKDPFAVFIHPPFNIFPDVNRYPQGLNYAVMAENPEWFLDPGDYITCTDDGYPRIPYPAILEPPRGWCPVSKKHTRVKDGDEWIRGEEPRLRCTFCRRHYAGVNAKSMWRRHVYEKHKIAMSNRRDIPERIKGSRASDKENKGGDRRNRIGSAIARHPLLDDLRPFRAQSRSSKLVPSNLRQVISPAQYRCLLPNDSTPAVSTVPFEEPVFDELDDDSDHILPSPVFTPQLTMSSLPQAIIAHNTPLSVPNCPPSPYDPTLSPAFRRISPVRPSEQPWRFPSPSHPLHCSPEELCLGVVVGGMVGDGLQSKYIPVTSSPLNPLDTRHTPLRAPPSPFTPAKSSPLGKKMITGRVLGLDKRRSVSDSNLRPVLTGVPKPTPSALFYNGPLPVPTTDRIDFNSNQDRDYSSQPEEYTSGDIESLSKLDNPFAAWLDIRDESLVQDSLPGSSGSIIPASPVARPSDLLSSKFVSSSASPIWPRCPSGFGLGLGFGAIKDVAGDEHHKSFSEAMEETEYLLPILNRQMTDPPSSQEDLGEYERFEQEECDVFTLAAPSLKRRRTIDVLR